MCYSTNCVTDPYFSHGHSNTVTILAVCSVIPKLMLIPLIFQVIFMACSINAIINSINYIFFPNIYYKGNTDKTFSEFKAEISNVYILSLNYQHNVIMLWFGNGALKCCSNNNLPEDSIENYLYFLQEIKTITLHQVYAYLGEGFYYIVKIVFVNSKGSGSLNFDLIDPSQNIVANFTNFAINHHSIDNSNLRVITAIHDPSTIIPLVGLSVNYICRPSSQRYQTVIPYHSPKAIAPITL